ncbi:hypothetical protein H6F67_26915 [Microcoleus sp. FACHB-1515]|uniref:hypothetical protein n=1 Tax=Cyanophyceae TaxID=3028117 RepID=UPI00168337CE|nr:hypothetical protein [Microcoleus sp. FACHB-1515]MBD2093473.1 hypothetical protein [Microcoleus sp. FACHB-1515]
MCRISRRSTNSFDRYVQRADELLAEAAFFETQALKAAQVKNDGDRSLFNDR